MKQISCKSTVLWFGILLFLALNFHCKKDNGTVNPPRTSLNRGGGSADASALVLSQTKTANLWADWGTTREYVQWGAQYVAADDNSYAYTKRVNKLQRVYVILQDFGFTIPEDALIENIIVRVRKFKTGRGQMKDCFVHLLTDVGHYGLEMANKIDPWPVIETETTYSQSGSGPNGILDMEAGTTGPYQWTPALINNSSFGLYFLTNFPDKGFCYLYFDQVQITVEYSLLP